MPKKRNLDKLQLEKLYIIEKKSLASIADDLGCGATTVKRYLDKFGIKTRPSTNSKSFTLEKGKKFGRWTIVKKSKIKQKGKRKSSYSLYECKCECGVVANVARSSLISGRSKSCGCLQPEKLWKGHNEISGQYWSRLKKSAKTRKYVFDITIEHVWELFLRQNRKCAISGMDICFSNNPFDRNSPQTASLDRINPNIGYIHGNVQWVDKRINYMKHKMTDEEFINLCKKVVEYNEF